MDSRPGLLRRSVRRRRNGSVADALAACEPATHPAGAVGESTASVPVGGPRVIGLDALLRELDGLRRTLETDLSLAASAVDAQAMTLARDIIAGGQAELRVFEDRALGYLSTLPGTAPSPATSRPAAVRVPAGVRVQVPGPVAVAIRVPVAVQAPVAVSAPVAFPRPRRRLVPAAPLIAAAALVALASGVLPHHVAVGGTPSAPARSAAAMSSYERLATLARDGGSADQVRAAARALHDELAPLVARAASHPAAAEQALALLGSEQDLLRGSGHRRELLGVLLQAQQLAQRLAAALAPPPPQRVIPAAAPAATTATTPATATAHVAVAPTAAARAAVAPVRRTTRAEASHSSTAAARGTARPADTGRSSAAAAAPGSTPAPVPGTRPTLLPSTEPTLIAPPPALP